MAAANAVLRIRAREKSLSVSVDYVNYFIGCFLLVYSKLSRVVVE